MNFSLLPLLLSLIPMLGWGTMDFLGAKVSRKLGEIFGLFVFQFVGLLLMLPLVFFIPLKVTEALFFVFILGIFNMGAWLSFMHGAKVGHISIVGPIGQGGYAIASILGIIFLKEHLNLIKVTSIFIVFVGVTLLSVNLDAIKKINTSRLYKGAIFAVIAAIIPE
ncbi:EamA family transporter [Candidatus Gottesmanbacteria bacterium]|nr:EamA family transporter [Candidatus Gottesmanbacteria bacterium]